ncbi:MAG: MmcQ/YjbR family DNA-binding protein [Muribaculaceae bacterium]|nr:MmcQ/YjbR family DNA-binding protein [Muribaculaceae bacterium]
MDVEELRKICLSFPQTKENMPWSDPRYSMLATFTVADKWFCHKGAFPAWHMNKSHWLGIKLESDIPDRLIGALVMESYNLIVAKLSKKIKEEMGLLKNSTSESSN